MRRLRRSPWFLGVVVVAVVALASLYRAQSKELRKGVAVNARWSTGLIISRSLGRPALSLPLVPPRQSLEGSGDPSRLHRPPRGLRAREANGWTPSEDPSPRTMDQTVGLSTAATRSQPLVPGPGRTRRCPRRAATTPDQSPVKADSSDFSGYTRSVDTMRLAGRSSSKFGVPS